MTQVGIGRRTFQLQNLPLSTFVDWEAVGMLVIYWLPFPIMSLAFYRLVAVRRVNRPSVESK